MKHTFFFIIVSLCSYSPMLAHAYIGPGAGVALIGTLFGFVAAVVASIAVIIAWPAWIIWKKRKPKKADQENSSNASE